MVEEWFEIVNKRILLTLIVLSLVDIKILFPFNILRENEQILIKFLYTLIPSIDYI